MGNTHDELKTVKQDFTVLTTCVQYGAIFELFHFIDCFSGSP